MQCRHKVNLGKVFVNLRFSELGIERTRALVDQSPSIVERDSESTRVTVLKNLDLK